MLMLSLTMPSLLQLMIMRYLLMSNPTNRMVFILLKHVSLLAWQISYDYLVLATGSTYRSQFKSSDTSTLYRASQLDDEMEQLKAAKSILIIGGGLVGCELASEISRSYNGINRHRKQITLIES